MKNEQYKQTEEYTQGQLAGREVYQELPNLDTSQQVNKAYERYQDTKIEEKDSTGEKRSNFMMGFGSGYYLASQS